MKYLWIGIVAAIVITSLVAVVMLQPNVATNQPQNQQTNTDTKSPDADQEPTAEIKPGRFEEYKESKLSESGYNETIVFFYAPWCPECRAFEMAIDEQGVPDGVQILQLDYDSSDELKAKYGVTLQTTFVKVGKDGELISKWVGYSQDKSVNAILENT
jgi:thioredoxin-like negative regulator of GroEL